jgi:hypothetical protein
MTLQVGEQKTGTQQQTAESRHEKREQTVDKERGISRRVRGRGRES